MFERKILVVAAIVAGLSTPVLAQTDNSQQQQPTTTAPQQGDQSQQPSTDQSQPQQGDQSQQQQPAPQGDQPQPH